MEGHPHEAAPPSERPPQPDGPLSGGIPVKRAGALFADDADDADDIHAWRARSGGPDATTGTAPLDGPASLPGAGFANRLAADTRIPARGADRGGGVWPPGRPTRPIAGDTGGVLPAPAWGQHLV